MVKDWINEEGYREKGYRERKLAEQERRNKAKRTTVTKSMTEKDIMQVWVNDDWGSTSEQYTDQVWREECEAKARKLAEERELARKQEVQQEIIKRYTEAQQQAFQNKLDQANEAYLKANDKQYGGDHYKNMGVEPWDVVDTWPIEQRIGAYRHGALKYLMRMGSKDEQLQEIKKCGHYIEKLIEVLGEGND